MKQKNYTFERVNGSTDHVELHRKGHHFHLLARLLCLVLAVLFWLLVGALKNTGDTQEPLDDAATDALYTAAYITETEM